MRRLLRQVHLWVGLLFSLLLFLLGATGSALVYKEAYWRMVYPELRAPMPAQGPSEQAAAIAAAWAEFGDELRSVKLPEPGVAAYHLYLTEGEAFLAADDHAVIDRWEPSERVMSLLFDLHAHLMAGEGGERVGGIVGLFGVLLAVTGLALWWPARRQFSMRSTLPVGTSRRALIHWHRDLGMIASPILLVLLLTGSGLVFYSTAGALLNGLFGDRVPTAEAPPEYAGPPVPLADASLLARVREEFPAARLVFYYPPRDGAAHSEFRLKQPCELHPNGRSYLHLDAAGRVLRKDDACTIPPGQDALHALYPLHAGKAGSALYQLVTFLGGLALAALAASGAWAYGRKLTVDSGQWTVVTGSGSRQWRRGSRRDHRPAWIRLPGTRMTRVDASQLSTVNCQLSIINYQLSIIPRMYPAAIPSTARYPSRAMIPSTPRAAWRPMTAGSRERRSTK